MARERVKLISVEYLKETTSIEQNVDDNKLVPTIYKVQDNYLQQILGSTFYYHLLDGVVNNSLTSTEETLIRNYIQPYIAEMTFYEVLPFIWIKPTNKSVSKESSEWSTSADLSDMKYIRSTIRDMGEYYGQRLIQHLCDYSNIYPKYQNPDPLENVHADNKTYMNGLYIPGRKGSCGCGGCLGGDVECYGWIKK